MKNTPYVKKYDKNGLIANPITKENPYLHQHQSTLDERKALRNSKNNKKGVRLIVKNLGKGIFVKYKVVKQLISIPGSRRKKMIAHYKPV